MNDLTQNGLDRPKGTAEHVGSLECPDYFEGDRVRATLAQLQQEIDAGRPVRLFAGKVSRISTLALQVVAAAQATAHRHGTEFAIISPSPEFERACIDTGFNALLTSGG